MKLFGKKSLGDARDQEEQFVARKKSKSDKDGSPPSSRLRRVKKEQVKPWGRRERVLVLILLILTVGGSALLGISAREWKLPGIPRIKLSMPSIPFLTNEKVVLEGSSQKNVEKASQVVSAFTDKTKDLSGVYGLYVIDLNSGFSFGINEHEVFEAASLIKLPVMISMFKESETGDLNLSEKYKLKNSDKIAGAGSLYNKPAGYEISYENLIRLMGKESDNTAFKITRNLLGNVKIDENITKMGLRDTSLENNETSPEDMGELFYDLWLGNILNNENKEKLLGYLTDTNFENWLSKGLPEDVRYAHKYGREVHVVNDAGIVYSDTPFVVVVLSKGVVEGEADAIFPELSKLIYDFWLGDNTDN